MAELQPVYDQERIRKLLNFRQEAGQIWLGDQRMLLLHAEYMRSMRAELIASLGNERAAGVLFRMGFASGKTDAGLVRRLLPEAPIEDIMRLGPAIHGLEGQVVGRVPLLEVDADAGTFYCESNWVESWEDDVNRSGQHVEYAGPSCFSQTGYASGYISALMGKPIIFKEVGCMSKGDEECTIVGKPLETWDSQDPWLQLFRPQDVETEIEQLRRHLETLKDKLDSSIYQGNLIGQSKSFSETLGLLAKAAPHDITVLLLGETGVGKEMFARWLHDSGPRAEEHFIPVNCGALPQELVESELFGVEKGAFTGAHASRPGRFERANGGTIFLDELGELSHAAQVKLLRVLQTSEFERVGGTKPIKVDVRIIAATNKNLEESVQSKTFRSDLYYRLNAFPVEIAPLRDRKSDIPLFVDHFISQFRRRHNKNIDGISERALKMLEEHDWPGNVRELENTIERAVLLAPQNGEIEVQHLNDVIKNRLVETNMVRSDGSIGRARDNSEGFPEHILDRYGDLKTVESSLIQHAMTVNDDNISGAARMLGITRAQLDYRLKARMSDKAS